MAICKRFKEQCTNPLQLGSAWPSLAQLGGKLGGCWPWGSILSNQMVRQLNSYRNHLRNPQFIDLRQFFGGCGGSAGVAIRSSSVHI